MQKTILLFGAPGAAAEVEALTKALPAPAAAKEPHSAATAVDAPLQKSILLFGTGIGDLAKSQVKGYTRSDGAYVQEHQDSRVSKRQVGKLKAYHKDDAKNLKSSLGSALSGGDTEGDDGRPLTHGDVKKHLHTMRSSLGPEHKEHLDHAQYAVNQAMASDHTPLSDKHAKLIGAALSGKTRVDNNGMVKHADR